MLEVSPFYPAICMLPGLCVLLWGELGETVLVSVRPLVSLPLV